MRLSAPPTGAKTPPKPATTHVEVRDGQGLVIGGLIRSEQEVKSEVPILGDLPVLGKLFRAAAPKVDRRNLIVFVTPRLVVMDD